MTTESYDPEFTMQRSSRDADAMAGAITAWLRTQLPDSAEPEVTLLGGSDSNGMSSETILVDVTWTEEGERRSGSYVVRIAPSADDVPVFAAYRLDHQFEGVRLVRGVPARPPVRGDPPGRRAVGRPGADAALARGHGCGPRGAVLLHGAGRRDRAAGRHALHVRRELVLRRRPGAAAPAPGPDG